MILPTLAALLGGLVDLAYPPDCVLCGGACGEPQRPRPRAPGLRPWDRPLLCDRCTADLGGNVQVAEAADSGAGLPTVAAARTDEALVQALGACKYHGVRGVAVPLARLMIEARRRGDTRWGEDACFVPVPLHGSRRRRRGFDQVQMLAGLSIPADRLLRDVLRRRRATGQQAKLDGPERRRRNLAGAFAAAEAPAGAPPVVVVDDLVTSGATVAAAAEALVEAGWRPVGALCLGLAQAGSTVRVDRPDGRF